MSYTEEEKAVFKMRLDNHLLDGISLFEYSNGWVWDYDERWDGHRLKIDDENQTVYTSYEKCMNSVIYLMRNCEKNEYAKNMAHAGMNFAKNNT